VRAVLASTARTGVGLARSPGTTIDWGLEVATKALRLAQRQLANPPRAEALLGH